MLSRFFNILAAKFSKLLGMAERPDEQLDYSYEQMQGQLVEVKRGVAGVVTAKKRIQITADGLRDNVVKLETQAQQAVAAGRDDLARQALERKVFVQNQLQSMDTQINDLQLKQDNLITAEKNLEQRIEAFRTQKEVIKASYTAAKASVQIGEAATGIGKGFANAGQMIGRAQEKVEDMEARASALEELTEAGALEDFTSTNTHLDRELAAISSSAQVDDELAKLKGELDTGKETASLEA